MARLQSKRMGLNEVLHPLSVERFMANYWQKKPYVAHGSPDRFEEIAKIPELETIDALLEAWNGQADAWAPRGTKNPVITAEPHQLSAFYESGYTLYLSRVEDYVPALEPLARQMELDLGLRFNDVYFEAFVSKGTGSAFHFDPNVTINIQLIGSKYWQVAENKHVVNPHMGWSFGTDVPELMQQYARQPFPNGMPKGARHFEARAGTLVYLHPGYWHCTFNHEPSLSLLYTVNPPSWAELLVEKVKTRLQLSESGRELAFGLGSTAFYDRNSRLLRNLLQEVEKAVADLDSDELLDEWGDSMTAKFERNHKITYGIKMPKGNPFYDGTALAITSGRNKEIIELPSEATWLLKWIDSCKKPFEGREAAVAMGDTSPELVIEMIEDLTSVGLLIRHPSILLDTSPPKRK